MTAAMYDAIWKRLFALVPELKKNVSSIHMDCEKAQIKAAKENLPAAKITGCLFHYRQVSFLIFLI